MGPLERGVGQRCVRQEHHHSLATCRAGRAVAGASMPITGCYPAVRPFSPSKAGMISRAKRRSAFREPPQLTITYVTPTRRSASSFIGDLIRSADQGIGAR